MPWKEVSAMSARRDFAELARRPGANIRELCRSFEISPTTAYKWIHRAESSEYGDRSRRPHSSPNQTSESLTQLVLELRDAHPYWNARKIRRLLQKKMGATGPVPATSTIGAILKRNGRITPAASAAAHQWQRFEHPEPNDLSQMDFLGHFAVGSQRCYSLTMLDDHSRFAQLLAACTNEKTDTVKQHLIKTFRRYGLPRAMNMDNGNPWGNSSGDPYTKLTVWLIRLDISISHSRPMHPQTNGKDERFHKTLRHELLGRRSLGTISQVQAAFDEWRDIYNYERPHDALAQDVPASRYAPSSRPYPETLPPIEYSTTDVVRVVRANGMAAAWRHDFYIGQAFAGQSVAFRPTDQDGMWNVYFCHRQIATVDQNDPATISPHLRQ